MSADVPLKKLSKCFKILNFFNFFLKMGTSSEFPIPVSQLADTSGYTIIQTYLCSIQCFGGEVVERRHIFSVLPTKLIRPNCEPKYTKGTRKGGYNILRELHSSQYTSRQSGFSVLRSQNFSKDGEPMHSSQCIQGSVTSVLELEGAELIH